MTLQFKTISIRLAVSGLILLSLMLAAFSFTAQAGAATTLAAAPVAPASAATITFNDPSTGLSISIPLNSYSAGAGSVININATGGPSVGRMNLKDMTVTWPANSNSPTFLRRMGLGKYFPNANIVFMDQATGKPAYTIGLGQVFFTDITQDQTFGGGIEETVTLAYGEKAELYPGGPVQCWSVLTNTDKCTYVKLP
jgi:hypothetical protein